MNDSYSYKELYKLLEQLKDEVHCLTEARDSWKYRYEQIVEANKRLNEIFIEACSSLAHAVNERDTLRTENDRLNKELKEAIHDVCQASMYY